MKNYVCIAPWVNFNDFAQVQFINSVSEPVDKATAERLAGVLGSFYFPCLNEETARQASQEARERLTPETHEAMKAAAFASSTWFEAPEGGSTLGLAAFSGGEEAEPLVPETEQEPAEVTQEQASAEKSASQNDREGPSTDGGAKSVPPAPAPSTLKGKKR